MHVFLPAGIYEIVNSHSTQLAYKLQLPEAPGKVQEELHIGAEGTFKVSIKVRGVLTLTASTVSGCREAPHGCLWLHLKLMQDMKPGSQSYRHFGSSQLIAAATL